MFACNLMDTVMTRTMQACKLTDYEMRSDYENAKHVLI